MGTDFLGGAICCLGTNILRGEKNLEEVLESKIRGGEPHNNGGRK